MRLRKREMLTAGVRSVVEVMLWQTDGFALAESYDAASGDVASERYVGLVLPNDRTTVSAIHDGLLLVRPDRAESQRAREDKARPTVVTDPHKTVTDPVDDRPDPQPAPPAKRRFFGTRTLSPDRYAGDFKKITDEVLAHLAAVPGVRLTVSLEIEAVVDDGFDEEKLRTVGENARTLKFDQHGFEEE